MPAPRRLFVLSFLPALAALLVTSAARAEEPAKPFGGRGQVAFDDIVALSVGGSRFGYPLVLPVGMGSGSLGVGYSGILGYSSSTTFRNPGQPGGNKGTTDTMWISPSLDVFVRGHFSVGATLAASYGTGEGEQLDFNGQVQRSKGSGYGFAIAPRVGYVIPLGTSFALWPRLTLGYSGGYTNFESTAPGRSVDWSNQNFRGIAELGLVARLHRYVYLRAAPELVISATRRAGSGFNPISGEAQNEFSVRLGATAGVGILLGG